MFFTIPVFIHDLHKFTDYYCIYSFLFTLDFLILIISSKIFSSIKFRVELSSIKKFPSYWKPWYLVTLSFLDNFYFLNFFYNYSG